MTGMWPCFVWSLLLLCSCRSAPVLLFCCCLLSVYLGVRCALPMRHCHLSFKRATYPSSALTDRLTVLLNEMDTKSRLRALQNWSLSRFHHHLIHLLSNSPLKATCYPGARYKGDWHSARCSGLPPSGLLYKSFSFFFFLFSSHLPRRSNRSMLQGPFPKNKQMLLQFTGRMLRLMAFMHLLYPL